MIENFSYLRRVMYLENLFEKWMSSVRIRQSLVFDQLASMQITYLQSHGEKNLEY